MSPINDEQVKAVRIAAQAAVDECRRSPVGNLLEAHLKVVIVDALLRAGYGVMEGSTRNTGKVIHLQDGRIETTDEKRPRMAPAPGSEKQTLSPDLRVWTPIRVVIELQIRTVLGSQDALFSGNLVDDLDRVSRGVADAFILAADQQIYDALRGIKNDTRGRKPKHAETCFNTLPGVAKCGESLPTAPISSECGRFLCLPALVRTEFGLERVVVAFWRAAQQGAPPNDGPTTPSATSTVAEGPSSVG